MVCQRGPIGPLEIRCLYHPYRAPLELVVVLLIFNCQQATVARIDHQFKVLVVAADQFNTPDQVTVLDFQFGSHHIAGYRLDAYRGGVARTEPPCTLVG